MCKHLKDAVFVVLLQSSLCLLLNCLVFLFVFFIFAGNTTRREHII